ncbi:MAG: flagellar hook-associated protein FlgK [Miltoncostaeaceae bacterium]
MASTFFGLNVALSGIVAQQRALNTVSHNITNAGTQGYSRQRVELAASPAYPMPGVNTAVGPGQLGTGVMATQHARMRDQFADITVRTQSAALGEWNARSSGLRSIDTIIDEPGDTGITTLLSAYWSSWQGLSTQPDSAASREAVRAAGVGLAQGLNDLSARLGSAAAEADTRIGLEVARANELAGQINVANQRIATIAATGQEPNDLRDLRDVLVDELAGMVGVTVTTGPTDKLSIAVGGQLLLDGGSDTVNALAVSGAGAVTVGGVGVTPAGGSIMGNVALRDAVIGGPTGYLARLDQLAGALSASVNAAHQAGVGLNGSTGQDFFTGTTAATVAVSAPVMASTDNIAASATAAGLPSDSDNAVAVAQLQFVVQAIGATTTTIDGFYQQVVAAIGVDADQAYRMTQVQSGVLDAALARRDSTMGVNLDEEAADMVRFTKSYNAAARMVTAVDEMLETIISRMGIVGR